MHRKRTFSIIRLQLEGNISEKITDELLELAKTEMDIKKFSKEYEEEDDDSFKQWTKDILNKLSLEKIRLVNETGISQEKLDTYVSFIKTEI